MERTCLLTTIIHVPSIRRVHVANFNTQVTATLLSHLLSTARHDLCFRLHLSITRIAIKTELVHPHHLLYLRYKSSTHSLHRISVQEAACQYHPCLDRSQNDQIRIHSQPTQEHYHNHLHRTWHKTTGPSCLRHNKCQNLHILIMATNRGRGHLKEGFSTRPIVPRDREVPARELFYNDLNSMENRNLALSQSHQVQNTMTNLLHHLPCIKVQASSTKRGHEGQVLVVSCKDPAVSHSQEHK